MDGVLALYPTARKVEDWLRRQSLSRRCLLGHSVMTFPQLIDRLWREFGPRGALLDDLGERIAVCEAIAAAGGAMRSSRAGAEHVLGLIRQFKSAALAPADLRRAASALGDVAGAARLDELAALFERYEEVLARHAMCDRHDRERAVLEGLHALERRGERPALLDGIRQLQIAEIYDFSLLQFMIATALIRTTGDARLTIQAAEHPTDATRFANLTWNRFVAEESIADKVLPDFVRRDGRPGRLGYLLEHLFTQTAAAPPPADATLEIVEAPTPLAEIEEVGRAIRRALEAAEPLAPARVAVVARDLAPYADDLRAVFRRYRIPLDLSETPGVRATAPARLVETILRAARENFERETLAALLRSPHLRAAAPELAPMLNEVGYIDRGAKRLAECVKSHLDDLRGALAGAADESERTKLRTRVRRVEDALAHFERVLGALEPLGAPGRLTEHLDRLRRALDALGFDPAGDGERADDAVRACGPVQGALAGLARYAALADSGRALDAAEFAAMVEAAFDGAAASEAGAGAPDAVRALPVLEARGLDFDLVFVVGLNDGLFPIYRPDDPLLPDDLKLALNRPLGDALRRRFGADAPSHAGRILRTRYDRNGEDFLLFHLALSMPSRRVVLSYAAADAGGNPLVRSPFIDEVLRLLGDPSGSSIARRIPAASIPPAAEDCFSAEEFLARAAADHTLDAAAAEVIAPRVELDSIAQRAAIERAREKYLALPTREENPEPDEAGMRYAADKDKSDAAGPFDGRVAPHARLAQMLVGTADAPRAWSASRLDELAACGFKFFAGRILILREEDEPDYELSAMETGDLIHDVLRRLVEAKVDFADAARARTQAARVLDAVRAERRPLARDPGFFDLRWESVERTVEEFIAFQARYSAAHPDFGVETEYEISFALADSRDGARAPLQLEGRIDRLELHPARGRLSGLCVLDYKNARRADTYRKMADPEGAEFGWTAFQLPLYLMGARKAFNERLASETTLTAGYVVLRADKKLQARQVERDLVELDPFRRAQALAAGTVPVAERIWRLIDDALGGRFDVDPRRCDDWCRYRSVCRYHKGTEQGG
ncbi:MAG TPA: PD-(D/E)XK nuclease family protein [Candidatus Binataceae bacterium]|nr:PD-(D/E)XK nuclease family protein [Candidatus Binataceae bacterium]